jgi:hypothetical protein
MTSISRSLAPVAGMLLLLLPAVSAAQDAGTITVPRGGAVMLDARLAPGEWDGAARVTLGDGTQLLLQHDGRFLYLALRATAAGFPSVCASDDGTVHVLHASASLGHAEYRPSGDTWTVSRPFAFGLRTRDATTAAQAERDAYLREHGWLGTTMYMGDRMQKEIQLPLSFLGSSPRIALAFMLDSPAARRPRTTWPSRLEDGCTDVQLVRGFEVANPRFAPAQWARLSIAR